MDISKEIERLRKVMGEGNATEQWKWPMDCLDILAELNDENDRSHRLLIDRVGNLEHPPDKTNPLEELEPCLICHFPAEYISLSSTHSIRCMNLLCGLELEFDPRKADKAKLYKHWNNRSQPKRGSKL